MNEEFKKKVIDTLRRGEELPREWARELFPPSKREYELVYYDKEREEDIIANTMALPLQPVSTFGKNGEEWHNMLIFGDNLQAMKTLLQMKDEGKLTNSDGTNGARLIYIDPPFSTRPSTNRRFFQRAKTSLPLFCMPSSLKPVSATGESCFIALFVSDDPP